MAAAGTMGTLSLNWKEALAGRINRKAPFKPGYPAFIPHIPLQFLGLVDIPAIPFVVDSIPNTLTLLTARSFEVLQSKNGLNNTFSIGGQDATGFAFMFGRKGPSNVPAMDKEALLQILQTQDIDTLLEPANIKDLLQRSDRSQLNLSDDPITELSLTDAKQFALSWTTFYNIYAKASANLLTPWAATLTDVHTATQEFWPTISKYGLAYNLLILQKVNHQQLNMMKQSLDSSISDHYNLDKLSGEGNLYVIDMTIFNSLEVNQVEGFPRFTPGSFTLLEQDSTTRELTPFTVIVSGQSGSNSRTYVRGVCSDGAWLYALQAAKTSVTVYGIWLGHVYHWHIVTAAMAMTMYNNLPKTHDLFHLLDRQSQYLIEFNEVLLLLWGSIAPPSSVTSAWQFLNLADTFAKGRNFFDDDPLATLNNLGLNQQDFTTDPTHPWNQYPIAGKLLDIWKISHSYVVEMVNTTYSTDIDVANDSALQAWMSAAGDPNEGNIKGLPTMNTKEALIDVLTSYIYRITAHGSSRLIESANPALTFVANFPPCFQLTDIPAPSANISEENLLKYLPKTGAIGEMIAFYYIFTFSAPYDSLIPVEGLNADLPFSDLQDARNAALVQFRKDIATFIDKFVAESQLPGYPADAPQYQQWSANVET